MAPNSVMLDTYEHVRQLEQLVKKHQYHPEFAHDMLQTIIECVSEQPSAKNKLEEFVEAIATGEHEFYNSTYDADWVDPAFSGPVWDIGHAVIEQLSRMRIYLPDGVLPYHYDLVQLPNDALCYDIVLTRTHALPYHNDKPYDPYQIRKAS